MRREAAYLNDLGLVPPIAGIQNVQPKPHVVPQPVDEDGLGVFEIVFPVVFILL